MYITKEILDMICDRDMVEHLKWEAKSKSKMLECTVYVYYSLEWCNATITTEHKGEENLFLKVEYNS